MHFPKIVFGVIVGIVLCLAIVLFMTKTTIPAIGLMSCAVLGIILLFVWPKQAVIGYPPNRVAEMYGLEKIKKTR